MSWTEALVNVGSSAIVATINALVVYAVGGPSWAAVMTFVIIYSVTLNWRKR
jgi:hypothetical protein